MKYLLLLFPFFSFAQTFTLSDGSKLALVDDKGAILVTLDATKEIQLAPGVKYKFILVEVRDNTEGKTITISEKGAPQPEPIIEKIDAEKATFAGTWVHGPTPAVGWYDGTIAFSNQPGSSVSYTFTGRGIELWSERKPTHGSGVITLSQGTNVIETKPVTFTGSDALPVKVYERTLPLGTYTIKLTVGTGYNLVDFYQVTK